MSFWRLNQLVVKIAVMQHKEFVPILAQVIECARIVAEPAKYLLTDTGIHIFHTFWNLFNILRWMLAQFIVLCSVKLIYSPVLNLRKEVLSIDLGAS